MGFGLFGKLPQKRDFMSVNLPHAVLNPFETWLQSAVAASRNEIGRNWENYYLVAPIWRFWLGKDILGTACTGSLMPSVDQVGRYFPLAIMYWAEPGETLTPPLINPVDSWYVQIESRMLAMLSDTPYEVGQILQGLVPPNYSAPAAAPTQPMPMPMPEPFAPAAPATEIKPVASPPPATPDLASAADEQPSNFDEVRDDVEPITTEPRDAALPAEELKSSSGPDEWDAAADRALEVASESLAADRAARTIPPRDDWMPEPMSADKLAELQTISAASFSPPPATGGSLWDLPKSAPAKSNGGTAAASPASPWDVDDAAPVEAEPSDHIAVVGTPFVNTPPGAPMAVLSETPAPKATVAAVAAAPAVSAPAAPAVVAQPPASPAVTEPPPEPFPAPTPAYYEPQITTSEFKGGMVAVLDGANSIAEALPQLMAAEFAHFAQSRGYWWCGPSSSGGPRLFSRAGLPDPYFYTRMLMWPGN